MSGRMKEFEALMAAGKLSEAQALLTQEMEDARYAPDKVVVTEDKQARFTRKGKAVELGPDKKWRLKPKTN